MSEHSNPLVNSCLYTGWVRHRRFSPVKHEFQYQLFMLCLDLDDIESIDLLPWWIKRESKFWWVSFCEGDYLPLGNKSGSPDSQINLKNRVLNYVEETIGLRPKGSVKMLAQCRYFGYIKNPLCTFYCYDETGSAPVAIVAEVHNTPWGERYAYVLDARTQPPDKQCFEFDKRFHVSPFNPIAMQYRWRSTAPSESLLIHLENWQDGVEIMDATLNLSKVPLTAKNLLSKVIAFPLVTVKIISAIYWQALKLWIKRAPFYSHTG